MPITTSGRRLALAFTAALIGLVAVPLARADEFIDRVNATFKAIPEDKRSDLVLLPLLPAMDAPPAVVSTQRRAALLGDKGPGWQQCADWAQKPAQKAVLEALDKVAKEEDRLKSYAFAQPYGVEGISVDLVTKGMYTELGEPPLLAAAQHKYLPALENVGVLVQVEASRRLADGDGAGALKVLTDWLFFCRQMADRPFMKEKKWALDSILMALMRLRDIVYQDLRAEKHTIPPEALSKQVRERMKERRGYFMQDRIGLPEADFVAYEQLVARIMQPNGGPDPAVFANTMARVSSTERPLRLFASSAYWDSAREGHAGQRDTLAMVQGLRGDWTRRWQLDPFNPLVNTVSDYRRRVATSSKYAMLIDPFKRYDDLFAMRMQLRTELAGTRMCMGPYGYLQRQKILPKGLEACRPEFLDGLDKDPYSKKKLDLAYFVPGSSFVIKLYPPDPHPTFQVPLGSDVYVIYSVGPDDNRGQAEFATQERVGVPGDYLLFPPVLSFYRQRLLEQNQLK